MVEVRKLTEIKEIIHFTRVFNRVLGYSNVPWRFFASGDCYASFDMKGRTIGGFVLVPGYWQLRAVRQMPESVQIKFFEDNPKIAKNLCDFTGYFILNPKYGLKLTIMMVLVCLFYKKRYFIYSYPVKETGLERYYGSGNPIRIHTGVPEKLEGHGEHMEEEHVEILSKLGIIKIFIYRTKRLLKSHFKK